MGKIICPVCKGSNVEKTTKGKVTEGAAHVAAAVAVRAAKEVANSMVFDGAGRLIPSSSSKLLSSYASVQHICRDCYQMLSVKFDSDGNVKSVSLDNKYSDFEIEARKDEVVKETTETYNKLKNGVTIRTVLAVLSAVYAICCINYPVAIVFGIIMCLCFAFAAVSKNSKAEECAGEIEKIRKMPLNEFRYKYM